MLQKFLIFSLCFVAIRATGEFAVLSSPKSLSFKGNAPLESEYVGDVLYAATGNAVNTNAQWDGLTINDPFNLDNGMIAVLVDGISRIPLNSNAKTYQLEGSATDESLNALSAEFEATDVPVVDLNFNQYDEAVTVYRSFFGDAALPVINHTKNLNPTLHTADKQFLQSVNVISAAADNFASMEKSSNAIIIRISLEPIAKAHGQKSEALAEAVKLLSAAISKLNVAAQKSTDKEALVVVITNRSAGGRAIREVTAGNATGNPYNLTKREVIPGDATGNPYNLAEYYNEDYPVIFNIILWFMVTFGLSLLAICYAIGSMDPGRDSIIYRMTSTRMKKDN